LNDTCFDTLTVRVADADGVLGRARARGLNLRRVDDHVIGISLDETTTPRILDQGATRSTSAKRTVHTPPTDHDDIAMAAPPHTSASGCSARTTRTQMLRYPSRLSDRDLGARPHMIRSARAR